MTRAHFLSLSGLAFLPGCMGDGKTGDPVADATMTINDKIEQGGKNSTLWTLSQIDKLSHTAALDAAKFLAAGSAAGVEFLENAGTQKTAEVINKYLIDCLLKNINPLVAAGIDTAATILDDVLNVPAGQMLTTAELELLASFVRGIGEGAKAYRDGKTLDQAPTVAKSLRKRAWLHKPE